MYMAKMRIKIIDFLSLTRCLLWSVDSGNALHLFRSAADHRTGALNSASVSVHNTVTLDSQRRLEFLKESAERYINDIEDGSRRLAIIAFSTEAKVVHTLMPVNVNTKQGFLNTVKNLETVNRTCIGCGLRKALELLDTPDETPEGAMIVLMSDGDENRSPRIADVKEELVKAKVIVNTIAMGSAAEKGMEDLAIATKAKAFAFQDGQRDTASGMKNAFAASTTAQSDEASQRKIQLVYTSTTFKSTLMKGFILEKGLGHTVVVVERTTQSTVPIKVWLIDPSGTRCDTCRQEDKGSIKTISIPSPPKAGPWQLHVESSSSREIDINIQVISQALVPYDEPIRATCQMSSLKVANPRGAIILTQVRKGKKIVLNADVIAEVTRPNKNPKVKVALNDVGFGADMQANDGTYSGYFTAFVGKGRYSVTAHVSGHSKARLVDARPYSRSSFTPPTLLTSPTEVDADADHEYTVDDFIVVNITSEDEKNSTSAGGQQVDDFQREASGGGSFTVTEDIWEEQVPPLEIRDLAVTEIRPEQNDGLLVQLTWTWTGAHMTSGNASSIDIRASKDDTKLKTNLESQTKITTAEVVEGNLDPLPPGTKHEVSVSLPRVFATPRADGTVNWRAFLAARVYNSDGLHSATSNIVLVAYSPPDVTTTVATTTAAKTTQATTTEASTTVATTTQPTTTQLTTTQAPTTGRITTTKAAITSVPSTPPDGVQARETSDPFWIPWMWIFIGGVAAVVVIAIVVGVLMKMSSKTSESANSPVADDVTTTLQ